MIGIDRRRFIAGLGGAAAVGAMSHEARADALEEHLAGRTRLAQAGGASAAGSTFPTVAEIEAQIPTRHFRRGAGRHFVMNDATATVDHLPPMPVAPTLADFFELRFAHTANHCLQSAAKALELGADEDIVLACLLHDVVQEIMRSDHGYWGAQLVEPYVSDKVAFAIRYHQALRFFPDSDAGYEFPDLYRRIFGEDYVPPDYIQAHYRLVRNHRWYNAPREVTVCDLYAFEPNAVVSIDPFVDIIGRHFRQPPEGLGYDDSPAAHMWRTIANPDAPL